MIDFLDIDKYAMKTVDTSFRGAVFSFLSTTRYMNSLNKKNFTYNMLKESVLTNQIVWYFRRNFFLRDAFNEKISQFKANGLINFWMSRYLNSSDVQATESRVPTSLNLDQVQGIFSLLICGTIVASVGFIVELIRGQIIRNINKCKSTKRAIRAAWEPRDVLE